MEKFEEYSDPIIDLQEKPCMKKTHFTFYLLLISSEFYPNLLQSVRHNEHVVLVSEIIRVIFMCFRVRFVVISF